ncbi:MAG: heavy-metal-associated domain-containing protein [Gemmatimonadaceae bacterium]|nr:heavy-metal-associated domain-containing protein [Gemmatimonadaceae bacterium]
METATIRISGMSCAHCVSAVQKALGEVPGLQVETVEIGAAAVAFEAGSGALAAAEAAIDEAGFDVVKGRVLNVAPPPAPDA